MTIQVRFRGGGEVPLERRKAQVGLSEGDGLWGAGWGGSPGGGKGLGGDIHSAIAAWA